MTSRLDTALVTRGLASGRQKAKELIAAGLVTVNGKPVDKASRTVEDSDEILCRDTLHRYVGRGGEKLEKVLEQTALSVEGCCCVDIGASTGGFTDCLLCHGAAKVYALDVGHGQLHERLRSDGRVINMEGTDVRRTEEIMSRMGEDRPTVGVVDVSFISLETVWPYVKALLAPDAAAICLIKPQFEAGKTAVGKRGVVRDPAVHRQVIDRLLAFWAQEGWAAEYVSYSPITGGEGNIEYLAMIRPTGAACVWAGRSRDVVDEAFAALR